jgi:hypothetical protein
VEGNLGLRRSQLEGRVPGAAMGTVEPAAEWMRMGEGRVDDPVRRNAENKLAHTNVGQLLIFSEQTIVRRALEIENVDEVCVVVGDAGEHADSAVTVLRRDQSMCAVASDARGVRQRRHIPPRRASSRRRTVCIAGAPPLSM